MKARVSFDFTGTAALITGGTSGIGHASAVLFRDAGAEVTITGTKPGRRTTTPICPAWLITNCRSPTTTRWTP
jgi:NAD(P)-dependent dehydrogenase (short-subunit alcohol dehydrogenase family)